ncbi:PEP-CTERM sorting domain-containing protein [Aeoliella sp. SH292]|uniref:PEP-CTERM sorting domain-containing protein n=1 Tax=Aeoliella sp. SH292 TaxID=3454464 RepID=UPI003F9A1876
MIRPLAVSLPSLCLAALAMATLTGLRSAEAASLEYYLPITPALVAGPTDVTVNEPGELFVLSVDLPKFDPSLGTLESAILKYDVDFIAQATTSTGGGLSGSVGGFFALDGMPFTGGGGGNGGGGGPGAIVTEFSMVNGDPAGSAIPFLTELTGAGTSTLTYNGEADLMLSSVVGATLNATGGGFTVTYNFTPIPEPATAVVLGGGLLAAALFVRRRG